MIIILQDREKKRLTVQTAPCHLQDCGMICRCSVCRCERKTVDWCFHKGVPPYELLFFSFCLGIRLSIQNTLTATASAPYNVQILKISSQS